MSGAPRLEARSISKRFPGVVALEEVSLHVNAGEIVCLLGDNGAGKSTLIKILSGVHQPDTGQLFVNGEPCHFSSPRDAREKGAATVYQDLAMMPLMPVVRNFVLGREPARGWGPWKRVDWRTAERATHDQLRRVGIELKNVNQPAGTLSGGQRQSVAIARAMYFGASVLILDEPTSALGVKEAGLVLGLMHKARAGGMAIIFVSHNVAHAFALGDRFTVLRHGRNLADLTKGEVTRDELLDLMAGGDELPEISFEDEESFELLDAIEPELAEERNVRPIDDGTRP